MQTCRVVYLTFAGSGVIKYENDCEGDQQMLGKIGGDMTDTGHPL